MKEVNYSETIVIPLLQKKFQELMNTNLVLEVNLLVEQAKHKETQQKLEELQAKFDVSFKKQTKKKDENALDGNTF